MTDRRQALIRQALDAGFTLELDRYGNGPLEAPNVDCLERILEAERERLIDRLVSYGMLSTDQMRIARELLAVH